MVVVFGHIPSNDSIYYYFLDVDSAIWLDEMCHMMLKY